MARLKTSGTLTLREVINFFGAGDSLRDFLRGGGIVPNIPENSGVPTSGAFSLRQLLGVYDEAPYTAISVAASDAFANDPIAPYNATDTSHAAVSGGDGSHTYSWTRVSGATLLVGSSTSATATFSTSAEGEYSAVYRVTVNDGITSDTYDINVLLINGTL